MFSAGVVVRVALEPVCAEPSVGKRKFNTSATQSKFAVVERMAGNQGSFDRSSVPGESSAFVFMK